MSDGSQIDEAKCDAADEDGALMVRTPSVDDASRQSQRTKSSGKAAGGSSDKRASGDVGQLLRGAYRQTVDEAIPDDLMDLLNKLE